MVDRNWGTLAGMEAINASRLSALEQLEETMQSRPIIEHTDIEAEWATRSLERLDDGAIFGRRKVMDEILADTASLRKRLTALAGRPINMEIVGWAAAVPLPAVTAARAMAPHQARPRNTLLSNPSENGHRQTVWVSSASELFYEEQNFFNSVVALLQEPTKQTSFKRGQQNKVKKFQPKSEQSTRRSWGRQKKW